MEKIQRSIISIYRIPCLNDLGFLSEGDSKVVYQQKHIRRWNEKLSSIHYLQGVFCADLRFDQLLRSIFPQHTVLDDLIFQQLLYDILLSKQTMNSLNLIYMEKNCWTLLLVELLPWHCATQDQKPIKIRNFQRRCAILWDGVQIPTSLRWQHWHMCCPHPEKFKISESRIAYWAWILIKCRSFYCKSSPLYKSGYKTYQWSVPRGFPLNKSILKINMSKFTIWFSRFHA